LGVFFRVRRPAQVNDGQLNGFSFMDRLRKSAAIIMKGCPKMDDSVIPK
jgi:hypothetical protein